MSEKTKITTQISRNILITNIPFNIIKQLNLTEYDELEWALITENNQPTIKIKPIKTEKTKEYIRQPHRHLRH